MIIILTKLNKGNIEYKIIDTATEKYNIDGTYKPLEQDLNNYSRKGWSILTNIT